MSLFGALGCSTGPVGGGVCAPNETQVCACAGGRTGVQTCNGAGTGFSVCDCEMGSTCTCSGRTCGADNCGNSCGTCTGSTLCSAAGQCVQPQPTCGGRLCSADGACGTCAPGLFCTADGQCGLDPSSFWIVTVTQGSISEFINGESWDALGGAPDPQVCLTMSGSTLCTSTLDDTVRPSWNTRWPATTANTLLSGVTASVTDVDVSSNDAICTPGTVYFLPESFATGFQDFGCTYANIRATLTPAQ